MGQKQVYRITPLAGLWIAGRRRNLSATTIELTPDEAEYELRAGTIVPDGTAVPPVVASPPILPTDTISITRNGAMRDLTYADLLTQLRTDLGTVATPEPSASSPLDLSQGLSTGNIPVT